MNSVPLYKTCCYCQEDFPATKQFFYAFNQSPDGLTPRCKTCFGKGRKPRPIVPDGKKWCGGCQRFLNASPDIFYRVATRRDGLAATCKECQDKRRKAFYQMRKQNGPGRDIPAMMPCSDCKESFPLTATYFRCLPGSRYGFVKRCKPCEYVYTLHYRPTPKMRENQIASRRTLPGRCRMIAQTQTRRARKANAPGNGVLASDIEHQYQVQKKRCYYCQKAVAITGFELDHIVPLVRGGNHDPTNVVLACRPCNRSKGSKLMHEWRGSHGRLL